MGFRLNALFSPAAALQSRVTPTHLQLLRACLWPDEVAVPNWHSWRESHDIATIDAASVRLLPLICSRLVTWGISDPQLSRLKGAHRYTWVNNQARLHHAELIATKLQAAGIQFWFMKGIPLLLRTYPDTGQRFINDIDLFVHGRDAAQALELLLEDHALVEPQRKLRLRLDYALPLRSEAGVVVDLHWHILAMAREQLVDEAFLLRADKALLGATEVRILADTAQLVIACIQMSMDSDVRQIRYMVDSYLLINGGSVDWREFILIVRQASVSHLVLPALRCLVQSLQAAIPEAVLRELSAEPRHVAWSVEFASQVLAPSAFVRLLRRWCLYRRGRSEHEGSFYRYCAEVYRKPARDEAIAGQVINSR